MLYVIVPNLLNSTTIKQRYLSTFDTPDWVLFVFMIIYTIPVAKGDALLVDNQ